MFEFLNTKWGDPTIGTPSGTINWDADLSGLDTVAGVTTDDLEASLDSAFDRWENAASLDFAEGGGGIDLTIGSAPIVNDPDSPNVIVAFAEWSPATGTLESAEITFNSNVEWSPNGDDGGFDFFAVALHEIGHIIGLDHPSTADEFPNEIMNIVVRADDLGPGDITAAQLLYGSDPGDDVVTEDVNDDSTPNLSATVGGEEVSSGDDGGGGAGGILAGLFALILGIFTGGLAAPLALAAASAANDDDEDEPQASDEGIVHHGAGCNCGACMLAHGHSHEVTLESGTMEVSHLTYAELPTVEFDYDSFESDDPEEENEDLFLV